MSQPAEQSTKVPSTDGLRILMVEDNVAAQKPMMIFLDRSGHKVTHRADGKAALAAYKEGTYDVILLDCNLPGMDGFQVAEMIRKLEGSKAGPIPIIAMTSMILKGTAKECIKAGMDDYLMKPVQFKQLANCLDVYRRVTTLPPVDPNRARQMQKAPENLQVQVSVGLMGAIDPYQFAVKYAAEDMIVMTGNEQDYAYRDRAPLKLKITHQGATVEMIGRFIKRIEKIEFEVAIIAMDDAVRETWRKILASFPAGAA